MHPFWQSLLARLNRERTSWADGAPWQVSWSAADSPATCAEAPAAGRSTLPVLLRAHLFQTLQCQTYIDATCLSKDIITTLHSCFTTTLPL